ncbi:YraN family protein [Gammaproteobacteria bacterium]|nr:YraN family protein [Gammaproteobacteria bacterium]
MKKSRLISPSQQKGQRYEKLAMRYLKKQGLRLLEQNFYSASGEIDLILMDADILVFVEVRFRENSRYGNALESVTYSKQKKILNTAKLYLLKRGLYGTVPCRFDVVGLHKINNAVEFQWIKNAFQ